MAGTTTPDDNQTTSDAATAPPLDLRPFNRIGCLGDSTGIRRFLFDLAAADRPDARVIAIPGALEEYFLDDPGPIPEISRDLDRPAEVVGEEATSLLVVALSRHERHLERLRTSLGPDVVLRTLYLDRTGEVEAMVVIGKLGERSLFVRPDRRDNLAVALRRTDAADVLFDRPRLRSEVGLAVLGPVGLIGLDYPLERHPKLTELVVYLALHRGGATSKSWTAALWPDRRIPGQTVANRLSEARRILGFATDGRPRLRRHGDRHHLVEFGSDWQEFQQLASSDDPVHWKEALSLVRGRPFEDLAQGQWVVFEGYLAEAERTISGLGIRLANWALDAGDTELCTWAAHQAIRANPFDERLHRLVMLAADAAGNRAGVEETFRQLAVVLEIEGDPLVGVHPETARLYARLTARVVSPA